MVYFSGFHRSLWVAGTAVVVDTLSPRIAALAIQEYGVTWRSSWQGSTRGPIPTQWGVEGYPTLYLIDHEGVIRYKNVRGEALDAAIEAIMSRFDEYNKTGFS